MRRKIARTLSLLVLLATGALGVYNGVRELHGGLTTFQYSVTLGVMLYGALGLAAGAALAVRHPWSVWLASLWGVVVTYVSSTPALAYAGADATVSGAVAGGLGAALIAAGVVWSARASARQPGARDARDGLRTLALVAVLASGGVSLSGCRALYQSPPVVGEGDGLRTKRVRDKREPDRLIADDLTVCWVVAEVFAGIKPGDVWRCTWRPVPSGT
ncbi:MAG: hypothetical protein ABR499_04370 [Gemmatimonadaceae bacterium]